MSGAAGGTDSLRERHRLKKRQTVSLLPRASLAGQASSQSEHTWFRSARERQRLHTLDLNQAGGGHSGG